MSQTIFPFRYDAKEEDFAEIARALHEHSQRNPDTHFKKEYTLKEIQDPLLHLWDIIFLLIGSCIFLFIFSVFNFYLVLP
jgi:hypothetical protein